MMAIKPWIWTSQSGVLNLLLISCAQIVMPMMSSMSQLAASLHRQSGSLAISITRAVIRKVGINSLLAGIVSRYTYP